MRDGCVGARFAELPQQASGHGRTVDREKDSDVVAGGPQAGHHAGDRRAHSSRVVDHVEWQLAGLADDQHLVARLGKDAPAAIGERLTFEHHESLRSAEAAARAADQQHARQRTMRHGSE